jgi:hypothetical protein
MTEARYRLCIVVLLAVFVAGALYIGFLISQNGRYLQYDMRREYSPDGKTHFEAPQYFLDTRTGRKQSR